MHWSVWIPFPYRNTYYKGDGNSKQVYNIITHLNTNHTNSILAYEFGITKLSKLVTML